MIIVKQEAYLVECTHNPAQVIEAMGRLCYRSERKADSSLEFVRMLMRRGHLSVIEHASASVVMTTNRAIANELVRHRLASYCSESTRYVDYAKRGDMEFVEPIGLSPDGREVWERACHQAEEHYFALRSHGVKPEAARDVLPLCLAARIGMTANFREWLYILALRTSSAAHPQMRELMEQVRALLVGACYEVFGDG